MKFKLPIGDWSGDGHGKCDWYELDTDASINEVRDAYFKAKEMIPTLCPEDICSDYEENYVDLDLAQEIERTLGVTLEEWTDDSESTVSVSNNDMIAIVIAFIGVGGVKVTHNSTDSLPMLCTWGNDVKGRHISHIGYGLFY